MSFDRDNWSRQSSAYNTGKDDGINGPAIFTYWSGTDNAATVGGANYFSAAAFDLCPGDFIFSNCSDTFLSVRVVAVDRAVVPATITTETVGLASAIGTANIVDGAVTTAKIADANVTSAKLEETLIRYARTVLATADIQGMYAAPEILVAAPGASKKLVLHAAKIHIDYGGTVLADGGAVHIQYAATANGAGPKATDTIAAATLIAATADTTIGFTPVQTTLVDSTTGNQGLYLSNATGAFTGGTSSEWDVDVWYSAVPI